LRKRNLIALAGAVAAVIVIAEFCGSVCFFKSVYGLPCPGCGLTRALLALAGGEIASALRLHPLAPLVPFLGLVALFRNTVPFQALYHSASFWAACAACFIAVWAVRMILYFPDIPPMEYSRSSLVYRAFVLICNITRGVLHG
jgi:hypothetical protein